MNVAGSSPKAGSDNTHKPAATTQAPQAAGADSGMRRAWRATGSDDAVADADQVVVCSYNVLSDLLMEMTKWLYKKRDPAVMPWSFRGPAAVAKVIECHPDIVLLQEIEQHAFDELFVPELGAAGYEGRLECRKAKTDGSAIFWRKDRFEAELTQRVDLSVEDATVLTWGNVATLAMLRERAPSGRRICAASTHLVFNDKRGEVKLGQAAILTHAVADAVASVGGTLDTVPTIIGGDFNSTPRSKIFEYFVKGRLRFDGLDRRLMSGQAERMKKKMSVPGLGYVLGTSFVPVTELPPAVAEAIEVVTEDPTVDREGRRHHGSWAHDAATKVVLEGGQEYHVTHPLRLASPFEDRGVTTYHDTFADVVDHILYSDHLMTPTATLELVGYDQLAAEGGMPSSYEPSDHQLIAVRLAFNRQAK
eukprot:m.16527 g.16527  ORF g.16527 m.16527 type:complete len:420 (+) comp3393_c0_seq1:175-1434(+)